MHNLHSHAFNYNQYQSRHAGSRGALSIFALHRTQWVGLNGAPSQMQYPSTYFIDKRESLGTIIDRQKIGPTHENTIAGYPAILLPGDLQTLFWYQGNCNPVVDLDVHNYFIDDDPSLQI
jgi:hypothetical protein